MCDSTPNCTLLHFLVSLWAILCDLVESIDNRYSLTGINTLDIILNPKINENTTNHRSFNGEKNQLAVCVGICFYTCYPKPETFLCLTCYLIKSAKIEKRYNLSNKQCSIFGWFSNLCMNIYVIFMCQIYESK